MFVQTLTIGKQTQDNKTTIRSTLEYIHSRRYKPNQLLITQEDIHWNILATQERKESTRDLSQQKQFTSNFSTAQPFEFLKTCKHSFANESSYERSQRICFSK